jgi:hypothetical protein
MTTKTTLFTVIVGALLVVGVQTAAGQTVPDAFDRAQASTSVALFDALDRSDTAIGQVPGATSGRDAHQRSGVTVDRAVSASRSDSIERAVLARELSSRETARAYWGTSAIAGDSHERVASATSPPPVSVTSSGREIEWPQVGVAIGLGILLALGLFLAVGSTRARPLSH